MISALLISLALSQAYPQHMRHRQPSLSGRARTTSGVSVPSTLVAGFYPGDGNTTPCACTAPVVYSGQTLTAARASNATCSKKGHALLGIANGDLVICSSDQLRMEPNTTPEIGPRLDASRTNNAPRSEEIDDVGAWSTFATGVADPVVTGDYATSPRNTSTAERLVFPACPVEGQRSVKYQIHTLASGPHVFSFWQRSTSAGSQSISLCTHDDAVTGLCTACTSTAASWSRCYVTLTGANPSISFGCVNDSSLFTGASNTGAADVLVWGAQHENGTFPSAYIPTTNAPVTRADETLYLTLAGNIPTLGSAALTFEPPTTTPVGPFIYVDANTQPLAQSTTSIISTDGTNTATVAATFTALTPKRYSTSWGTVAGLLLKNETAVTSDTDPFTSASWTGTQINLTDVGGAFTTGIITRLCVDSTRTGCQP